MKTLLKKSFIPASLLVTTVVHGQNVSNFYGFGVFNQSIYGFNNETTRTLLIADAVPPHPQNANWVEPINHLATDASRNRLLYVPQLERLNTVPGETRGMFSYDLASGTVTDITNGFDFEALVGYSTGGGSFYNGDYYLFDDVSSSFDTQPGVGAGKGVVKISFNGAGLISSVTKPYGNLDGGVGELGDIAIDASGQMFIFSSTARLYKLNLNNPVANFQLIGDYSATTQNGQLMIDNLGRIITRDTVSGDWLSLNPNGPSAPTRITGPAQFSNYGDLTEGGVVGVVIPEPSSLLLGAISLLALGRRKRSA